MKVSRDTTIVVKVELTEEEARWLISLVQNPIYGEDCGEDISTESVENSQMRETFYYGLTTALNGGR